MLALHNCARNKRKSQKKKTKKKSLPEIKVKKPPMASILFANYERACDVLWDVKTLRKQYRPMKVE